MLDRLDQCRNCGDHGGGCADECRNAAGSARACLGLAHRGSSSDPMANGHQASYGGGRLRTRVKGPPLKEPHQATIAQPPGFVRIRGREPVTRFQRTGLLVVRGRPDIGTALPAWPIRNHGEKGSSIRPELGRPIRRSEPTSRCRRRLSVKPLPDRRDGSVPVACPIGQ